MRFNDDDTYNGGHIPESARSQARTPHTPQIPPEDNVPKGCSLQSMEPLREWFRKGADMTSPAEYEVALCQLEEDPPDIRQYNEGATARTGTMTVRTGTKNECFLIGVPGNSGVKT